MGIDFKKVSLIDDLLKRSPVGIYVVMAHPWESDSPWPECAFFYKQDALRACYWLNVREHKRKGVIEYKLAETSIRKWKGE
jgi:hypothetical protein